MTPLVPAHAWLYVITVLVVASVPGPDMLYVIAQTLMGGRGRGLQAILGIQTGFCVHVTIAILALTAFIAYAQPAFFIIREAGAVYLIYLGLRRLFTVSAPAHLAANSADVRSAYLNGMVTNVSNPKAALFTYSLLPQFITPSKGEVAVQILGLAVIAFAIGMSVLAVYMLSAALVRKTMRWSRGAALLDRFGIGGLFLGLGVRFAISNI